MNAHNDAVTISVTTLLELLHFLQSPLEDDEDLDRENGQLLRAFSARSKKLGHDPVRLRKYFTKFFHRDGIAEALRWGDIALLARRIRPR